MNINKKAFAILFIAATLLRLAVYFFMPGNNVNGSYEKYLSGEYYFRAEALTVSTASPFDTSLDISDPKTFLLMQNGVKV